MDFSEHDDIMVEYYGNRVPHWHNWDVSTSDGKAAVSLLQWLLADRDVLEIACGPAFWSDIIAETARSVYATDYTDKMIEAARTRPNPRPNVEIHKADAYQLDAIDRTFSAGYHFQWISHVPLSRLQAFLDSFHDRLAPGARVVYGDNRVAGEETDEEGNHYTVRDLPDGSTYRIIKNYPTEAEVRSWLPETANEVAYICFRGNWFITYIVE